MLRLIVQDVVNDVAIIETSFCFNVRYGLEITPFNDLTPALDCYRDCLSHALATNFDM